MIDLSAFDDTFVATWLSPELVWQLQQPEPPPVAITEARVQLQRVVATLQPFVPAPVLRLRSDNSSRDRISGKYLNGTVVFTDLSGFTVLSSRLAMTGRQGNEEVSALVNKVFAALLAEIHGRGGGIVRFGGDSLTAFFDANELGQTHVAQGAAAALAMQQRMEEFATTVTSVGSFALQLRTTVHTGKLFIAEVGDDWRTNLVATGRMLNRVIVAQERTVPGEVTISEQVLRAIPDVDAVPQSDTLYRLQRLAAEPPPPQLRYSSSSATDETLSVSALLTQIQALQPYLPHGLPQRRIRPTPVGGEFRPVTVLFANFYAFDKLLMLLELPATVENDASVVGNTLQIYYNHVKDVLRSYNGSINKIDMDTSGNRLMALFGAPTAHEDDEEHAVRTALALGAALGEASTEINALLRDWVQQYPQQRQLLRVVSSVLPERVGIASGTVYAGIVGSAERHEYTVIGNTVNLSARLLSAARDGDILVSSLVRRTTRHLAVMEPLSALHLKGFTRSVPVFRVAGNADNTDGQHNPSHHVVPLVGRAAELAQMLAQAAKALRTDAPEGQVVAVCGEPGIGKTRLVEEVIATLRDQPVSPAIVRESCQSYERDVAYSVFGRLLPQLLALQSNEFNADVVQQRLDTLVPEWSRFGSLLAPLLNIAFPETELVANLGAEQRSERLQDLLVMICRAVAQAQSLLLVIEDIHWIDASSQALVERLAYDLADQRALFVLTYRSTPPIAEPWQTLEHTTTITLAEFDADESAQFVEALLDGPPPAEIQPFLTRIYGLPLFLEETIYYLREARIIDQRDGTWICHYPPERIAIPSQIEQLIVARLDQLSHEARTLANLAAVVGQRVDEQVLEAMPTYAALGPQSLSMLLDAEILLPDDASSRDTYHFRHALTRDVAYDSMLFVRRRQLHAEVATAIEQVYGDALDGQQVVLAQHWLQAGATERAFPHFLQAARDAQTRYAHREALSLYRQVLETAPWQTDAQATPDATFVAEINAQMGDIQALLGDYSEARSHYEWCFVTLGRSQVQDEQLVWRAELQRKFASTYEHQGQYHQALTWLNHAAATLETTTGDEANLGWARVRSDVGWVHFRQGELAQAEEALQQAQAIFEQHEDEKELASIFNRLGGVAWQRGNLTEAQHYVEQSLTASEHCGNLIDQAWALNNLGILAENQGDLAKSLQHSLRAMETMDQIGSGRGLVITAINVGVVADSMSQHQDALEYFTKAVDWASSKRDTYHQMLALLNLGRVLTALARDEDAERVLLKSQYLAAQLNLTADQIDGFVSLAELALQRNNLPVALEEYQRALVLATDADTEEFGRLQRLEAKIALVQGDTSKAIESLQAAEASFTRLHNVPEVRRTRRLLDQVRDGET